MWVNALVQRVREDGRVQNVAVVLATGVNADGHREVLGVEVITAEDGAGWTAFLRGLLARWLCGRCSRRPTAHRRGAGHSAGSRV